MSDSKDQADKVLIIGGGPGGLVLAQILHDNGVPFEIFERDEDLDHSRKGWAVALIECLPELRKALPKATCDELPSLSVNYNINENDELGFVNATTGKQVGTVGGVPFGQPGSMLRVTREKLRYLMWKSNDMPVTGGKRFTRFEEDDDGVTAFFADGSSARGAMLIGADGAHSHVREGLIGAENKPILSKFVPIFGQANFDPSVFEPIRKLGNAVILAGTSGMRLMVGVMDIDADRTSAEMYWALMRHYDDEEQCKSMSHWVSKEATKPMLYDEAIRQAEEAGFAPEIMAPIRAGGVDGIFMPQPPFIEFVPPDALPAGRVTLLGDAAHAMIPFRGAGANTAINDACLLGRLLAEAKDTIPNGKDAVSKVLQEYNATMLPRGQEMVLSSRAAGEAGEKEKDVVGMWAQLFARK